MLLPKRGPKAPRRAQRPPSPLQKNAELKRKNIAADESNKKMIKQKQNKIKLPRSFKK